MLYERFRLYSSEVLLQERETEGYDVPVRTDIVEQRGPLSAILSSLVRSDHRWVFVVAGDMPYVDPRIIGILQEEIGYSEKMVMPQWEEGTMNRWQHFIIAHLQIRLGLC